MRHMVAQMWGVAGGVCVVEPTPELLVVIASAGSVPSRGPAGPEDAGDDPGDRDTEPAAAGSDQRQVIGTLRGLARVTAILLPRLALVVSPPGGADALARLPGVVGVFTHTVPAGLRETLTATENLFVDAWLARLAGKRRLGEGMPWDAADRLSPERQRPDPPDRFRRSGGNPGDSPGPGPRAGCQPD
nr:hypothetical protein [Frankia sp. Cj3]